LTIAAALIVAMATCPFAQGRTVTVRVTAERFRFSPDEIKIRCGETVEFRLESDDTDHGFRILGTGIDRVIPKRGRGEATLIFSADTPGRYTFECSKMCGAGHSFMRGEITVEE